MERGVTGSGEEESCVGGTLMLGMVMLERLVTGNVLYRVFGYRGLGSDEIGYYSRREDDPHGFCLKFKGAPVGVNELNTHESRLNALTPRVNYDSMSTQLYPLEFIITLHISIIQSLFLRITT